MLRCLLSSLFGPGTASSTAASWPDAFMFRMGLSAIGCKQSEAVIRKKFDEVCTCLVPCNNEAPTTVTTAKESHPAGAHLLLHLPCHRWESYTYARVCTGGALLWCKMPCGKSWSDTRQHLSKLQRLSLLILQHPLSHPGWNLKSLLDRGTLPSCHHLRCISGSRGTTASGDHYRSDCQPLDLQCKRPNHPYFKNLFFFHCEHYSDERIPTFSAHKHKMICIWETQGIVPSLATALEVSLGPRDDQGKLLPHQELRRDEEITGLLFFGNLRVGHSKELLRCWMCG